MSNIKKHRPYLTVQEVNELYRLVNAEVRSSPDNWTARDLESTLRKLMTINVGTSLPQSLQQSAQQSLVSSNASMEEMYASFKQLPSNLGQSQMLALFDWLAYRMDTHPLTDHETFLMLEAGNSKAAQDLNRKLYGTDDEQEQRANAFKQAARNTPKTRNPFDL